MNADCSHCWHIVGVFKKQGHGAFAPPTDHVAPVVHRCCQCGRHEITTSSRNILPEEIIFDPGCEPKGATA